MTLQPEYEEDLYYSKNCVIKCYNPPDFHCSRIMLVLGRDGAYQILFPQVPHEVSCKEFDLICKKNLRKPDLWDLNTAYCSAWGKHCALLARSWFLQHQKNRHRAQKSVPNPPAAAVWVYRFVCLRASPNQGRGGNLQSHLQNYSHWMKLTPTSWNLNSAAKCAHGR